MNRGRIVIDNINSACLEDNPLGDPAARKLAVYLPPGYEAGDERYPVVYFLAGFTGRGTMLLNERAFDEAMDQRLDRLIGEGAMSPAIVVMPDCFTRYGGSQYLDSAATGNYETYLVDEIIPYVDGRFRTIPVASKRAVMGKSSGGYGAMVLAMRHPDRFGIAASHSGDMGFEYCYAPDFPEAMIGLEKYESVTAFLDHFYAAPKKSGADFLLLNVLAMAAAYSPNPETKPHLFDLPFDTRTCEMRGEVWLRWLQLDPVRMVETHRQALGRLKLYIECGTRDEYRLYAGSRMFSARLHSLGIEHVYEEFDDNHRDTNYRYDISLKQISEWFAEPGM